MENDRFTSGGGSARETMPQRLGTVLVIDDEPTVRAAAANMLSRFGYRTLEADGGEEGLRIFSEKQGEVDLVLLDLTMPGLGGEETFHRLRLISRQVRIVLMSGFDSRGAMERLGGGGQVAFIQKPFTLNELRNIISTAIPPNSGRRPPSRDLL